jgi:hypothetical protein
MRERECPKCGIPCEYIEAEPDVGINGGFYCDDCDEGFGGDEEPDYDDTRD